MPWIARGAIGCALIVFLVLAVSGCGTSSSNDPVPKAAERVVPGAKPQVVEPQVGSQAVAIAPSDPIGDPSAHAPALTQVKRELHLEVIYAPITSAGYIDPLQYVNHWERTDQGVDANLPVGAPILAPGKVKILDIEPDWYAGQPLIYFELLDGSDAGQVQYVAEEITDLARPGSILQQGQVIARYASSGTGIEYGWSTLNGITLAVATTGYEEGEQTPAGKSMRAWLNGLGAKAGPNT